MADERPGELPWDRAVPGEGAAAFRAFGLYRDLGRERSLTALAAALCAARGKPARRPDKPPGRLCEWSRRFGWLSRCAAYDAHRDALRVEAFLAAEAEGAGEDVARAMAARRAHLEKVGRLAA